MRMLEMAVAIQVLLAKARLGKVVAERRKIQVAEVDRHGMHQETTVAAEVWAMAEMEPQILATTSDPAAVVAAATTEVAVAVRIVGHPVPLGAVVAVVAPV